MSLNDLIKAETERLGFTLLGAALPTPPAHIQVYERWLQAGLHAEMAYLAADRARERRANPALILPEAETILVVAMRYFSPQAVPDGPAGEALGRVAAYAWGTDYHLVLPPLLEELVGLIEKSLGRPVRSRAYSDTGPILEHDLAQSAGLGWTGKNTCLISPRHGSYFLIGETFVDVEVEPDQPFSTDHCGSCRRCIDDCPTSAIRSDRTIDSVRCISYQTIENKGIIPEDLRPKMGDWVFGCDICQMVCPWNIRFSSPDGHPALAPRPGVARPVLRQELSLSPEGFNQKFRGSPIKRAKRRGYLRNLAVALGNQPDPDSAPALAHIVENEPEALVRGHSAWALGRTGGSLARRALDKALKQERDAYVLAEIRSALEKQSTRT